MEIEGNEGRIIVSANGVPLNARSENISGDDHDKFVDCFRGYQRPSIFDTIEHLKREFPNHEITVKGELTYSIKPRDQNV